MAPNRPFANYPGAKAVKLSATPADAAEEDKNPILHGLALVAAASLVNNVPTLQRFFWNNAKFGVTRDMPELAGYDYRLHPDVVPLPIRGEENTELDLDFGLDLKTPAPEAKGRYLSSVDYQTLYRDGTLTPLDVVSALLPLTRRNQTPENKYQNAWPLGPLDGVPVSVKDDIDVEGYVSHMGLREGEGGRLPVGLMALGEWGAEEQLLAWAGEGERYLSDKVEGGRVRPEAWVDVLKLAKEAKAKGKQSV
ncbi:Rab proteins geranylgeranyltransferase component A 1 [Verticillium dahliae VDG1]|nr:Rab proteins geranylgeranyltransferase component A 1 [Verticillium dahliae VDG1]